MPNAENMVVAHWINGDTSTSEDVTCKLYISDDELEIDFGDHALWIPLWQLEEVLKRIKGAQ